MNFQKSACIDAMFTELPWEKRFQAAKSAGFEYIEFWNWADKDVERIRPLAEQAGIGISGFNGDQGYSLIDPAHRERYVDFLKQSIAVAQKIGAHSLTIHSNALGEGGVVINPYGELSDTVKLCSLYRTLLDCVPLAVSSGIQLNLEALNVTTDHQGNFLQTTRMGAEICRMIDSPKLKLLYDVYHMQLNEGSISDTLSQYIDQIGHIHVADAPGRHEPGTGEINYPNVFAHLRQLGYKGLIGFELFPKTDTRTAVRAITQAMAAQ